MKKTTNPQTILWASNGPGMPTGYSTQTEQVVSRMHRDGHKVSIASNYGTEGHVTTWKGVRVWPRGMTAYSEDVITAYAAAWAAENDSPDSLVIGLFDAWVYSAFMDKIERIGWWTPIDHAPAPPGVLRFLSHKNVTPIAMSKFGRDMIEKAGLESLYVPHALEKCWKPTASVDGATGRQLMQIPDDAYVIMLNQANKGRAPSRKAWAENLYAAASVMRRHDDVWLYIHTDASGIMDGVDIPMLLKAVGAPADRVRIVDQFNYRMGIPQRHIAAIYTAADIMLACSLGEGFGLTPLEAAATGLPVVVSDFTAQPELVGEGWKVSGQPFWDANQAAWWLMPSIAEIEEALEQAYARGHFRSQKQIDHAATYAADLVYERDWKPVIEALSR